jgi:broad specificity phosphatase PhoE
MRAQEPPAAAMATRASGERPHRTTTVILVRHAEKGTGDDPGLTARGVERARELAAALEGTVLDAAYATQFRRSRETAAPAAERFGLPVRVFEAAAPVEEHAAALAALLLAEHDGETVLVVVHRDTVPLIVEALGGEAVPPIADDEYSNLYVVVVPPSGPVRTVRARYGAADAGSRAVSPGRRPLGTLAEQAALRQEWLELRLRRVLPRVMREQGVGMWIVPMREYNEDPVFRALVSPTTMAARRRTIYVFCDRGEEGFDRIAIGGTSQGGLYRVVRERGAPRGAAGGRTRRAEPFGPEQWKLLLPIVEECDPETIAVNISRTHAFSDGLSAGEREGLEETLRGRYLERIVRRERLALDYLAERLPEMMPAYVKLMELARSIIRAALSDEVVEPGVTRTDDVVWWMRQRANDLGLGVWFQPSLSVQRWGVPMADSANPVILRGDVLHTDFGLSALGLHTDTHHNGYVLRSGETEAPDGLLGALERANRLQEILLGELRTGRTGNEVLASARTRMLSEGIDGTVYTHPIGDHGHGAGPLVGLWDRQQGVPGRGDLPVRPNSWFSIELQATTPVAEWGGEGVRMALEEEAAIDGEGEIRWVLAPQTRLHLIR